MAEDVNKDFAEPDAILSRILEGKLAGMWRISLFTNIYFGPVLREFENVHKVTQAEFAILYCVSLFPGIGAAEVCDVTGRPQNSVSRGVNRLLERGMVRRETDRSDKRRRRLMITETGSEKLAPLLKLHAERQVELLGQLDPADREMLDRIFDKLLTQVLEFPRGIDEIP